jgi:uncharacterized protein YndB with AHSA1/START domain
MNDVKTASELELRIERLIAAPPEQVYAYWTDPGLVVKWFGPEGYDIPESAFDVRVGGAWTATMRRPDGTRATVSGTYRTLEPPRRVAFTWAWVDDKGSRGHETTVSVTCETAPGGTRMTLVQREFETQERRDQHNTGWSSSFKKLDRMPASAGKV